MSLRFNHIFTGLLLLSAICAFAIPVEYSDLLRGRVDGIFFPVAYPVRRAATALSRPWRGRSQMTFDTAATPADARQEIQQLRALVASLTVQIEELRRLNAHRELAGEARKYSLPFKALGETGQRDTLVLAASSSDGIEPRMPVMYANCVIGRLAAVGPAGARVQLASDVGFKVSAGIWRFQKAPDGRLSPPRVLSGLTPLLEGRGNGLMTISNLKMKDVETVVQPGDWVVLTDPDWPQIVHGCPLGHVVKVEEGTRYQLFAEITVQPLVNPLQLSEAMVVTNRLTQAEESDGAAKRQGDDAKEKQRQQGTKARRHGGDRSSAVTKRQDDRGEEGCGERDIPPLCQGPQIIDPLKPTLQSMGGQCIPDPFRRFVAASLRRPSVQ